MQKYFTILPEKNSPKLKIVSILAANVDIATTLTFESGVEDQYSGFYTLPELEKIMGELEIETNKYKDTVFYGLKVENASTKPDKIWILFPKQELIESGEWPEGIWDYFDYQECLDLLKNMKEDITPLQSPQTICSFLDENKMSQIQKLN